MRLHALRWACLFMIVVLCATVSAASGMRATGEAPPAAAGPAADERREAVDRVLRDYINLYAWSTLEPWKALFHPALTVASPNKDGTVLVRNLDQFVGAQRNYFATGRKISERLENVRIEMGRRIARVTADFIFMDEREERPGKLGLHLVEGQDGWRIVAIVFAYDAA